MRQRAAFVVMATLVLQPSLFGTTASAAASDRSRDKAIERAFEDVLDREPTEREFRRYRDLMEDEYWTERDIRDDLRERSDYRRHEDPRRSSVAPTRTSSTASPTGTGSASTAAG